MDRGFQAVLDKLPSVADKDIGTILKTVGMTLVSTVGGAGGPLYGTFFMQMGTATAGKMELTLADWAGGAGGRRWTAWSCAARPTSATRPWWMR